MKYMKIFKLIKSWATICEIEVYTYKGQIVQIPSNRHWNAHHHLSGALDMMIAHLPCVRQRRTMWEHKVFTYFCWIWNFGTPTSSGVIETMLGNPFSPIPRPKSWNLRVREKSCPRSWDRCPDQIQFQGGVRHKCWCFVISSVPSPIIFIFWFDCIVLHVGWELQSCRCGGSTFLSALESHWPIVVLRNTCQNSTCQVAGSSGLRGAGRCEPCQLDGARGAITLTCAQFWGSISKLSSSLSQNGNVMTCFSTLWFL